MVYVFGKSLPNFLSMVFVSGEITASRALFPASS